MVSVEAARALALGLAEAVEQDHHGRPSFRVSGRIFATLWDEHHMNVMLDEPGILTAVQSAPEPCSEFWWGSRLRAAQVDLRYRSPGPARELLADAWEQRGPRAPESAALLRDAALHEGFVVGHVEVHAADQPPADRPDGGPPARDVLAGWRCGARCRGARPGRALRRPGCRRSQRGSCPMSSTSPARPPAGRRCRQGRSRAPCRGSASCTARRGRSGARSLHAGAARLRRR